MNLDKIAIPPHAEGFIKVAFEHDEAMTGNRGTRNAFVITARHHVEPAGGLGVARLAEHPIAQKLAIQEGEGGAPVIREIPIRLHFNSTDKALRIGYQAYTNDTRHVPVCSGNGQDAYRNVTAGDGTQAFQQVACPGPESCQFSQSGEATCHRQVRMAVQIKGQPNPLSVFEVRTTSLNSYRALKAQLQLVERRFKGLRHVPLKLTLWQASNEVSGFQPFDLMQLTLDAESELAAMQQVQASRTELANAGIVDEVDTPEDESPASIIEIPSLEFHGLAEVYATTAQKSAQAEPKVGHSAASQNPAAAILNKALSAAAASAEKSVRERAVKVPAAQVTDPAPAPAPAAAADVKQTPPAADTPVPPASPAAEYPLGATF